MTYEIKRVAVLGAGVLGTQIAFQTAYHGFPVSVRDISDDALDASRTRMGGLVAAYRADGVEGAAEGRAEEALDRITFTTELADAVADTDLVIEAAPEVLEVKRAVYAELAGLLPQHTIVATNSSTLLPSDLEDATGRPDRFLALHYANLVWKQNTAEIMGTADTDPAAVAAVVAFAEATGLVPIELKKEQAGYILNSLLVPLLMAGLRLWTEGVADPATIDTAWRIGSGVPAGPFQILDVIGLTTPYNILNSMDDPSAQAAAQTIKEQYLDKGKLGVASGEGFYTY